MPTIAVGSSSNAVMKAIDSTTVLYANLVLMSNTTASLTTNGNQQCYHQWLSPTRGATTDGEGGFGTGSDEIVVVVLYSSTVETPNSPH